MPQRSQYRRSSQGSRLSGPRSPIIDRRTLLSTFTGGALFAGVGVYANGKFREDNAVESESFPNNIDANLDLYEYVPPQGPLKVAKPRKFNYGRVSATDGQAFGELYIPQTTATSLPVVVMVHGGGWRSDLGLHYMRGISEDMASYGVAVWNIEYRRVGSGGGWPTTPSDVCDAVDFIPKLRELADPRIDPNMVFATGHSAGGQLATWLATRPLLPRNLPGADPSVKVRGVVSMAGVVDLIYAFEVGKDMFLPPYLGGEPKNIKQRYWEASPISHLPSGIPVTMVHGVDDKVVMVEQARRYYEAAIKAGDPAGIIEIKNTGHHGFPNVNHESWRQSRGALLRMIQKASAEETLPAENAPPVEDTEG